MSNIKQLLILPHIKVHNANALSSPFTIGFPALTGFLGAVHALQRKLNSSGFTVAFDGVGVISHDANLQTYKGSNDFVHSIVGTGNPLDKTGSRSAFIEEARIHLDVSLLIEINNLALDQRDPLIQKTSQLLHSQMKIAGGDIQSFSQPELMLLEQGDELALKTLQRKLMPGYALIERRELMKDAMCEGQDALDAMIDYLAIHHHCEVQNSGEESERVQWRSQRKQVAGSSAGWIVPIATGFHGISEIAQSKNQRDETTPHRFAECVVTLGEFKMPHRIKNIEQMLWHYYFDEEQTLYLGQQNTAADRDDLPEYAEETPDQEF